MNKTVSTVHTITFDLDEIERFDTVKLFGSTPYRVDKIIAQVEDGSLASVVHISGLRILKSGELSDQRFDDPVSIHSRWNEAQPELIALLQKVGLLLSDKATEVFRDGYKARMVGVPREANGYGFTARKIWLKGWTTADEVLR